MSSDSATNSINSSCRLFTFSFKRNPATSSGPPLGITWQYEEMGTYDLNEYENQRTRRTLNSELILPRPIRQKILLDCGYTKKEIIKCTKSARLAREARIDCLTWQQFEEWHILFEWVKRRYNRFRTGVSKEAEQTLLWTKASQYEFTNYKKSAVELSDEEPSSIATSNMSD